MDKILKVLERLTQKEKKIVKEILSKVAMGQSTGLDIKKLKTKRTIFRVRKGKIRIIYQQTNNGIKVLTIERRSDTTYKNF